MIEILYAADGYVIVNKPVGADSEDKGEGSAPYLVRETLGVSYAEPCHRLDKVAGGALLVATDKKSAARLCAMLQSKEIEKEYFCVCEGAFSENERTGEMTDLLFFDRQRKKSYTVKKKRAGVKEARLWYEVIAEREHDGRVLTLCRVLLDTGRTHQIRVQFASRAHALSGDGKYGSRDNHTSTALICRALTFDGVRTECPLPETYPWNLF